MHAEGFILLFFLRRLESQKHVALCLSQLAIAPPPTPTDYMQSSQNNINDHEMPYPQAISKKNYIMVKFMITGSYHRRTEPENKQR